MDQSLSCMGQALRPLTPTLMIPQHVSPRAAALADLTKVSAVRVSRRRDDANGTVYVVDVTVETPKSRIPTATSPVATATYSSSRRLSEFAELHTEVFRLVQLAHNFEWCEFCEPVLDHSRWGHAHHRTALAFCILDEDKLLRTLEALARDLIQLAIATDLVEDRVRCRARDQLPVMAHRFLFGDERPER